MFAQNFFRAVKAANLISTHNQLTIAWNNLIWQFRQHISELTEQIIMKKFLEQLDSQISIWHEMTTLTQFTFRKFSKSFFQYQSDKIIERYRDDRFYRNNNAYQNSRQKRSDRSLKREIVIKVERTSNERDDKDWRNISHDKKDRYRERDRNKSRNKITTENIDKDFKDMNKEKIKTKTYLIQDIDQENDDNDDYHDADNLNYFDSDYNNEKNDIETTVSFAMISKITCRRCKLTLKSNNALHKHLRTCIINANSIVLHIISKLSTTIRCSNVDVNKNIDIDYEFKDYQYASTEVALIENENLISVCANTEAEITLADIEFFNATAKNVSVRTMIISITVRKLSTMKHSIDKYVIVSMYFSEKDKHDEIVRIKITRKIHFVNNLKANMLIRNDVLRSEKFDIFTSTSTVYIESCEIIISISICEGLYEWL